MTAPLPNARQQVRVSRVLGDDHYKRIPRVTVDVARWRNLIAQWPWVPSIGQHLQPFTGNVDVSIWVKTSRVGQKTSTNTNKPSHSPLKVCLVWVFLGAGVSHSRIFHSFGEVIITGRKGLQMLTYTRHSWQLSSDGSFTCHTYFDTGQLYIFLLLLLLYQEVAFTYTFKLTMYV